MNPAPTECEFTLSYPPRVLFGWGAREHLPEVLDEVAVRLGASRPLPVLLVCTRSAARIPGLETWRALCRNAVAAEQVGVPAEPTLEAVDGLARMAAKSRARAVVAVGGGSVIDAAKAAAAIAPENAPAAAFFYGEKQIQSPGLPLIALPTTAGSGAEITRNSVLLDPGRKIKKSLRSPFMTPAAAVVDPELTLTMPKRLTAASGIDALTQALESFISRRANVVSRILALEAARLLFRNLLRAFEQGGDRAARTAVARGSLLGALSFSQGGLGAAHGLGHPIGALLGLAHGLTCGILLPRVLEWNAPVCREALDTLAAGLGLADGPALIAAVQNLVRNLGIPPDFKAFGLGQEHFDFIVAHCRSGSMAANPRPMSDADIRDFLAPLAR